jgi:single-strand DNA-binding protein
MSGGLSVSGVGRLGGEPELSYTASGAAVVSVSAAFTVRTLDKASNQWRDKSTTWVRLNIWRQMAENVAASLSKGDSVYVDGTLESREYEKADGTKGQSWEILVDTIGPDLRFQQAKTVRPERNQGSGGFDAPPVEDPWTGEPAAQRTRPPAQQGHARTGQWSNGQSTTQQPTPQNYGGGGGFADEPPF